MIWYKIRHKPTGLFFKPTGGRMKINVSKKGKVYQRKPSFSYLSGKCYLERNVLTLVILTDWEIVEFDAYNLVK